MWNWTAIYEDDAFVYYCDLEKVIDVEGDEDGIYDSVECYRPMPEKVAVWLSIVCKNKEYVKKYKEQRKAMRLTTNGYTHYQYTLCLVEIDAKNNRYRVIPAIDYDEKGHELGTSSILTDEHHPLVEGIKTDWAPIRSRKTHKMIPDLLKRLYLT
jgi:hypothetical protein